MPHVDMPDLIDLVCFWLKNHETLGNLSWDISRWPSHKMLKNGKVIVLKHCLDHYTRTDDENYIASFNCDGHLWRWDKGYNKMVVDEVLDPSDPIFFERLEVLIRKAMVMRVL